MTKGVEVILREGEGRERGRGLNYCQALPQPWRDNQERLPKKGPLCYLERASKSSHWGKGRGQRKEPGKVWNGSEHSAFHLAAARPPGEGLTGEAGEGDGLLSRWGGLEVRLA